LGTVLEGGGETPPLPPEGEPLLPPVVAPLLPLVPPLELPLLLLEIRSGPVAAGAAPLLLLLEPEVSVAAGDADEPPELDEDLPGSCQPGVL
jgi:hypothetical protein